MFCLRRAWLFSDFWETAELPLLSLIHQNLFFEKLNSGYCIVYTGDSDIDLVSRKCKSSNISIIKGIKWRVIHRGLWESKGNEDYL